MSEYKDYIKIKLVTRPSQTAETGSVTNCDNCREDYTLAEIIDSIL